MRMLRVPGSRTHARGMARPARNPAQPFIDLGQNVREHPLNFLRVFHITVGNGCHPATESAQLG